MRVVCTACSCLCDDVLVKDKVYHACRKGFKLIKGEREETSINGEKSSLEESIKVARDLIDGKKLLIFGLDNTTCEAQEVALKIAKDFEATILDHSFIYNIQEFLKLPSIKLEKFRDEGYVSIFWGSNPHNSMPRLLSRFIYYPRSGKRQKGYEEDRFLVVADLRKSETAKIAEKSKSGLFIKIDNDYELIKSFIRVIEGKACKYLEVAKVLKELEKAEINAIFGGGGLLRNLKDAKLFKELIEKTGVYFVPTLNKANHRGYIEMMIKKTGFLAYDFKEDTNLSKDKILNAFKDCDVALIVASDPLRTLPYELSKILTEKKLIIINSLKSIIAKITKSVVISTEISPFSGGSMIRCDGVKVQIERQSEKVSDLDVLKMLMEV